MKESTKKVVIVIVILLVIGLVIFLVTRKKEGYQSTSLIDCKENCLNIYPNDWESWERQTCMTRCNMTDKDKVMSNGIRPSVDWINDFNLCVTQQCGVIDCAQKCDSMFVKPIKPSRESFTADEDYYQALNIYNEEMKIFMEKRGECFFNCEDEVSGGCKKKCCVDAKLCNFLKTDREKANCKNSCEMVGKMKMIEIKKM
jgi:hypothetical protein